MPQTLQGRQRGNRFSDVIYHGFCGVWLVSFGFGYLGVSFLELVPFLVLKGNQKEDRRHSGGPLETDAPILGLG